MLYRRPKLTKLGYAKEVTGPWSDPKFYSKTPVANSQAAAPTGADWSVLKDGLVNYWSSLNIDKV